MVLRLLKNVFTSQKNLILTFYSWQTEGNYSSPQVTVFQKSILPSRKGRGNHDLHDSSLTKVLWFRLIWTVIKTSSLQDHMTGKMLYSSLSKGYSHQKPDFPDNLKNTKLKPFQSTVTCFNQNTICRTRYESKNLVVFRRNIYIINVLLE